MDTCTYCGFCKSVCPVFAEQNWDSSVARGKLSMAYGLLMGDLKPDPTIVERIFQCTMCMDCVRRCPSGIKVMNIIEAARGELVGAGYALPNQKAIIENIKTTGNIYADPECWKFRQDGELPLFLGCQYGALGNRTRQAVKILEKLGIKPLVQQEICCGSPMKSLGFIEDFEAHKKKFRETFPHGEVLTICPTCNMFLHEEYGIKSRHIFEVLAERLAGAGLDKKMDLVATYHDPCHMARGAGVHREPRDILAAMGVEILEMEQSRDLTRCCGGGGGILISDPSLSDGLAKSRLAQAVATGAKTILTSCPTCESTLKKAAMAHNQAGGETMSVKNVWDLLWTFVKQGPSGK
jgi:Fe-S oxidoreductase